MFPIFFIIIFYISNNANLNINDFKITYAFSQS